MWAFKTDTKQVLTFNLDMFRHIRKHEQENAYIDIINYKIESWKFGPQYIYNAHSRTVKYVTHDNTAK